MTEPLRGHRQEGEVCGFGLGIYLSKKLLDGLYYARIDGKNRLELRKRL
jgi:hypothetical protein